jgi:hypothetical protein
MNQIPMQQMPHMPHIGAGNGMDMIRQNLMTMFMMKSVGGSANTNNKNNDIYTMLYSMVALFVIERIMGALPLITEKFKIWIETYYTKKMNEVASGISNVTNIIPVKKTKESSITVEVQLSNSENVIGHALLDYATNLPNTVSIIYRAKTYSLNHGNPIIIDPQNEVYIVLKNPVGNNAPSTESSRSGGTTGGNSGSGSGSNEDVLQIIEIYSYELNIN